MNNLAFLLLAVVVSVIGAGVVMYRHRPPTGRTEIDEFRAVMGALAPERDTVATPADPADATSDTTPDSAAAAPAQATPDSPAESAESEQ